MSPTKKWGALWEILGLYRSCGRDRTRGAACVGPRARDAIRGDCGGILWNPPLYETTLPLLSSSWSPSLPSSPPVGTVRRGQGLPGWAAGSRLHLWPNLQILKLYLFMSVAVNRVEVYVALNFMNERWSRLLSKFWVSDELVSPPCTFCPDPWLEGGTVHHLCH